MTDGNEYVVRVPASATALPCVAFLLLAVSNLALGDNVGFVFIAAIPAIVAIRAYQRLIISPAGLTVRAVGVRRIS
jgi:hypothetical protein